MINKPLSYLIGATKITADGSRVIEVPYDEPRIGIAGSENIAYCNLFHENFEDEGPIYAPYLPDDDVSGSYGEGRIDPRGKGWRKNLDRQYALRRDQRHTVIELDNPDSYEDYFDYVIAEVENSGFQHIAKNPHLLKLSNAEWYAGQANVVGVVLERSDENVGALVQRMQQMRLNISRPALPLWFVAFDRGSGQSGYRWAKEVEQAAGSLKDIGVTYSRKGEYTNVEDVLIYQPGSGGGSSMAWRGRQTALGCKTITDFKNYLRSRSYSNWRPSGIVFHNTASPNLEQWWHGGTSPETRLKNLRSYYENTMGWSAGPHAFVDGVTIWIFTDFDVKGVHSPSYNATRLGIEAVGDYARESDETGAGKKVLDQMAALFGECCSFFGWEVDNNKIKFHKEDPATDHDCPGKNVVKSEFLADVTNYMADGGDHGDEPLPEAWLGVVANVPAGDRLNIRASASSSAAIVGQADNGDKVKVISETYNGSTKWYRLQVEEGGLELYGWASSKYIERADGQIPPKPPGSDWNEAITATEFGGRGDEQESAYGGWVDGSKPGVALPYKWRESKPPNILVVGPSGSQTAPVVDVGPWNLNDPDYVNGDKRPMVEEQYRKQEMAQNGQIPTNNAAIDLTPATALAVGIHGKGVVKWKFGAAGKQPQDIEE